MSPIVNIMTVTTTAY